MLKSNGRKFCECGCGQPVKNRFVNGHQNRRRYHTEETKKKISDANKGRCFSKEHKEKLSVTQSGENNSFYEKHHTAATKKKMSVSRTGLRAGKSHYNYGKHLPEETKKKISDTKSGENHPMYGKPAPQGAGVGKGSYCEKGHWVRSTWERAVADWLFDNDINYEYEPKRFVFNSRISYLPDFYIPKCNLYIEVKGYMRTKNKIQHKLFERRGYDLLVIDDIKYFEQVLGKEVFK